MEVYEVGELFSESLRRRVQRNLIMADVPMLAEEYLGWSLILSILLAILLLSVSFILSLLAFVLVISSALYLPSYLAYVRSRRAESELPFFLKSLSTLLKSGIDPMSSLEIASRGNPVLRKSVERIIRLRKSGTPLSRAFEKEADTYTSERIKRSLMLVYQVIEGGYGVESLDRYAESLINSRRVEIKEFSNKLALYTLVFIALTALTPSILLMYSLLIPSIFHTAIDVSLVLFTLFFVVPLLTVVTLGYISSRVG